MVKFQSNSELAGFLRNALRRSGPFFPGVKHCFGAGYESGTNSRQTKNTVKDKLGLVRRGGISFCVEKVTA